MVGRVALRNVGGLLIFLLAVFIAPATASAQWQWALAAINVTLSSDQSATAGEPFGLSTVPVTFGGILDKWTGLETDVRADREILAYCRKNAATCPAAAQKFLAVIAEGRAVTGRARIGVINRAVNMAIRPMSDLAQWGVPDRWSAPLETFSTGRGDCEDYAIAKYVALTEAGVAEEDLRFVVVRDLALKQDHAVIAARLSGKWIVLDNRWLTLVEDTAMRQIVPLFVLDRDGVKQFTPVLVADAHRTPAPAAAAPGALGF